MGEVPTVLVTLRMSRRDVGASAKIHHHHRVFAGNWRTPTRTPLHVTQQHQNSTDDRDISCVWRQRCPARPWNRIRAASQHCSRAPSSAHLALCLCVMLFARGHVVAFSVVLSRLWNGQRDRCLLCWVKSGGVMLQRWGGMMDGDCGFPGG